jgi:hypothetical protein
MATDPTVGLENGNVVMGRKVMSYDIAGDASANYRDLQPRTGALTPVRRLTEPLTVTFQYSYHRCGTC